MRTDILTAYQQHPMTDGDVVLLVGELQLATEIEGLADHWDPLLCHNTALVLQEIGAREVELGIARPGAVLHPSDHLLVADLREELADAGITVLAPVALPGLAVDSAA